MHGHVRLARDPQLDGAQARGAHPRVAGRGLCLHLQGVSQYGYGTLAGEHTEQFRREMLTAHAQTLAKAGNKAGKETPYEGAY